MKARSPKLRFIVSVLVGILTGILFHYLLYRMSLSTQPFIYVAF